jgi:predicted RND superfamily exporter protein
MGKEKFTTKELTAKLKSCENQLKYTRLVYEEMSEKFKVAQESSDFYFAKMDEAYKEQEQMLRDINNECLMSKHNLFVIRNKTSEITGADVAYHLDLIVRKIKHKYGKDTSVREESL